MVWYSVKERGNFTFTLQWRNINVIKAAVTVLSSDCIRVHISEIAPCNILILHLMLNNQF